MNSSPASPSDDSAPQSGESIGFSELHYRIRRGLVSILGLGLIGLALGLSVSLLVTMRQPAVSTIRLSFGFPGFELGTYPNGTKFQPDDIRAPDVINEAVKRLIPGASPDLGSKIRGALSITPFVSPNITKERDRLRATGQALPPFVADEYEISLSLPRNDPLDVRQRELLLAEIVNVYLEKFRRTYVELPPEFSNAFTSLRDADYIEYELVLTKEMQSLQAYLEQKIDTDRDPGNQKKNVVAMARVAKQFRSPTNNLSFQDLLIQAQMFTQIRLNDVLSQIYAFGLSKDRKHALVKMDYYLRTLEDQEQRLREEETVVLSLLTKTQDRAQNYVLANKGQSAQGNQPMIDQAFIDSLLANDAYNFLVRRALDAGLAVKRVQADRARMLERRQQMESFAKDNAPNQNNLTASTQQALSDLERLYQELLSRVRVVMDDYARQEFADAVRVTMQAKTLSLVTNLLVGAIIGGCAGLALGLGLSLVKPVSPVQAG